MKEGLIEWLMEYVQEAILPGEEIEDVTCDEYGIIIETASSGTWRIRVEKQR